MASFVFQLIKEVLGQQAMYYPEVLWESRYLAFILYHLKTGEICNEAVRKDAYTLGNVPDHLKTKEICQKAVEKSPQLFKDGPDHFKTQDMCDNAVRNYLFSLQFVRDWFVTQQQIDIWDDNNDYCNDDEFIEW